MERNKHPLIERHELEEMQKQKESMYELSYSKDFTDFANFIRTIFVDQFGFCSGQPEEVTVEHTFQHSGLNFSQVSFEIKIFGCVVLGLSYDIEDFVELDESHQEDLYQGAYNTLFEEIMTRKNNLVVTVR